MTRRLALLFCLVLVPGIVAAQGPGASRSVAVTVDNDLIAVRGRGVPPDYDYTHGATVAISWAGAPKSVRRVFGDRRGCSSLGGDSRSRCLATALAFGQRIYTPRLDAQVPVPGERPYAGWLYAAGTAHLVSRATVRTLTAEVGVTGPPSLAEPVQNAAHRLLHNEPQIGWPNQLATGAGVVVGYEEVRRADREFGTNGLSGIAFRWAAAIGTVVTGLSAGAEATIGVRGIIPWSPAEPELVRPARLYLLGAYRHEAVLHSVFVKGRGSSGRATRIPFVGQAEIGVGYRWRSFALEYRHVARGREYEAQPGAHSYGSLSFVMHSFQH